MLRDARGPILVITIDSYKELCVKVRNCRKLPRGFTLSTGQLSAPGLGAKGHAVNGAVASGNPLLQDIHRLYALNPARASLSGTGNPLAASNPRRKW